MKITGISRRGFLKASGVAGDRKWPLYVWGQGRSGVENPSGNPKCYDDGVNAFCSHFREAMRWHTEAFRFKGQETGYLGYDVPTQKDWSTPVELKPVCDIWGEPRELDALCFSHRNDCIAITFTADE